MHHHSQILVWTTWPNSCKALPCISWILCLPCCNGIYRKILVHVLSKCWECPCPWLLIVISWLGKSKGSFKEARWKMFLKEEIDLFTKPSLKYSHNGASKKYFYHTLILYVFPLFTFLHLVVLLLWTHNRGQQKLKWLGKVTVESLKTFWKR